MHVPTSDPSYAGFHGFELDGSFHCYQETVGSIGYSHAACCATYLNKSGCDYTYSELLGYHLTQHCSAVNYQRDALAAPIRCVDACHRFNADSSWTDQTYVTVDPSPVDEQMQSFLGKDLNELTEVFMLVAVEDIADGNGPADLQEMWDLLYQEPYLFGANARCSFRGRSCDDAHTFTDVDDSDEGLLEESSGGGAFILKDHLFLPTHAHLEPIIGSFISCHSIHCHSLRNKAQ